MACGRTLVLSLVGSCTLEKMHMMDLKCGEVNLPMPTESHTLKKPIGKGR